MREYGVEFKSKYNRREFDIFELKADGRKVKKYRVELPIQYTEEIKDVELHLIPYASRKTFKERRRVVRGRTEEELFFKLKIQAIDMGLCKKEFLDVDINIGLVRERDTCRSFYHSFVDRGML